MKIGLGLLLIAGSATAAPPPITLKVQDAPLFDVARKLSEQSGCRIVGYTTQTKITLDVTNVSLWDVLAKLEVDHGIQTQFRGSQISLDLASASVPGRSYWTIDPTPTWTKHWRGGSGGWATSVLGDANADTARLLVLGTVQGTIDKVVIEKALAGGKPLKATPGLPVEINPCAPAIIQLSLDSAPKKVTLRGHVVIRVPKVVERRIQVPLDGSVVDVAEGRLRVHVASKVTPGSRTVHVGWDGMGDPVKVEARLVDDTDVAVSTSGRGSSMAGTMGSEDFTVSTSLTRLTVILRLPGTTTTEVKVPFRFDNETLDRPVPQTP